MRLPQWSREMSHQPNPRASTSHHDARPSSVPNNRTEITTVADPAFEAIIRHQRQLMAQLFNLHRENNGLRAKIRENLIHPKLTVSIVKDFLRISELETDVSLFKDQNQRLKAKRDRKFEHQCRNCGTVAWLRPEELFSTPCRKCKQKVDKPGGSCELIAVGQRERVRHSEFNTNFHGIDLESMRHVER